MWNSSQLTTAIKSINDGEYSIKAAGKRFSIPESTLRKRMKTSTSRINASTSPKFGRLPILNKEQESHLKTRLIKASNAYCGLSPRVCRKIAFNSAEKANLKHRFSHNKKQAGVKWLKNFFQRNGGLSVRKPESTSLQRITGFSKSKVDYTIT